MFQTIALIVLISSFLGLFAILVKKIPILASLSVSLQEKKKNYFFQQLKVNFGKVSKLKEFFGKKLLLRVLSKLKILALKSEMKIEKYLQQLRKKNKSQEGKKDNYWEELKEIKK